MSQEQDLDATAEQQAILNDRVKPRSLRECSLPAGFRLVHPQPKQSVVRGQVRWVFVLGYGEYYEIFEYNQEVPDEAQLAWAVDSFRRQLLAEGVIGRAQVVNPRQQVEAYFARLEANAGMLM